jgi:hypothetical protein
MPVLTIDIEADELGAALLLSLMEAAWTFAACPSAVQAVGLSPDQSILRSLDHDAASKVLAFGQGRRWNEVPNDLLDSESPLLRDLTPAGQSYYVATLMYAHLTHFRYLECGVKFLDNLLSCLGEFDECHLRHLSGEQMESVGLFLQFCLVFAEDDPLLVSVSMKWADLLDQMDGLAYAA